MSSKNPTMLLTCYLTSTHTPQIIPAPPGRGWMDRSQERYAYRCLPLSIANSHGWMILNEAPFTAEWNGGDELDSVSIDYSDTSPNKLAVSHFGNGVLTFHVHVLFRTEPGYNIFVTGPTNAPKDAIQPLAAVVETDWLPFTFTMNWKFTRKMTPVAFERNEPFCMIFPEKRRSLENFNAKMARLDDAPELKKIYDAYSESREKFNAELRVAGSPAQIEKWQKHYIRGAAPLVIAPQDHQTSLTLKPFLLEGEEP